MIGSHSMMRSPSSVRRSRKTPCVAGCCGPTLSTMSVVAKPLPRDAVTSAIGFGRREFLGPRASPDVVQCPPGQSLAGAHLEFAYARAQLADLLPVSYTHLRAHETV